MSNAIIDKYQSAYLPRRSTETALTMIINHILIYLDNQALCYLVLLDLSSAFDTLDHNIISIRLNELAHLIVLLISLIGSLITPFP